MSKNDFAIAMHLIKAKLAGKDIPDTLPLSLVAPPLDARIEPPPEEISPFEDSAPVPTATPAPAPQARRASDAELPLPPLPPRPHPPPVVEAPPSHELSPDEPPRSQTPPPPYALVDAATPVDS